MIWKQADGVPAAGRIAVKHLQAPLNRVENLEEGKTFIHFGDENFGCSVLLVTEHDQQVVDDIVLVAGVQPELRARLKRKMREQIAFGAPETDPNSQVLPAANWEDAPQTKTRQVVNQADYQDIEPLPRESAPVPLPSSANLQRLQKALQGAGTIPQPPLPTPSRNPRTTAVSDPTPMTQMSPPKHP